MTTTTVSPSELQARLDRGEKLRSRSEMTDEYYENLVNLMLMQADSELAGGFGYVPWIMKAPGVEEKLIVANLVKDEIRHAKAIYGLLRDLGIDVDARVAEHDFNLRVREADLGSQRVAADKRVNIFYYPIDTWSDFIMFNFMMDRGAGHQLEDGLDCSYEPWATELKRIAKEETTHLRHGDLWVERMAQNPATKDEIQDAVNRWFPRTMNIFGRPGTPRNALYRRLNLKKRDNDAVRQAFVDDITPKLTAWGLTLPEWRPAG